MIIEPPVSNILMPKNRFARFWIWLSMFGAQGLEYRVCGLLSTFVRQAESAASQYNEAVTHLKIYYDTPEPLQLGSMIRAGTLLENCFNAMHRATTCMASIRGKSFVPADIKALFDKRPSFAERKAANKIRTIRNTIQHMHDDLIKGTMSPGTLYSILPTGDELPFPDPQNPDQTRKVIDRLKIGDHEILLEEMTTWLRDMVAAAQAISNFERTPEGTT